MLNLVSSTGRPHGLQNLPGRGVVQLLVQNTPSGLAALDVPTPPPLDSPPALVHYTLESPWALGGLLVLGAAVAFSIASKRENRRPFVLAGCQFLTVAVALVVVASVITTPREAIIRATRALVGAVATADAAALDTALDEQCTLYYFQAPEGLGRAGIMTAVAASFSPGAAYRVGDWDLEAVQARATSTTTGQAQVKVFVRPEQWNFPHRSWWRIDLRKDTTVSPPVWRATAIMPLEIQGVENARGR